MPLAIVWSIGLMGLGGSVESMLRRLGMQREQAEPKALLRQLGEQP